MDLETNETREHWQARQDAKCQKGDIYSRRIRGWYEFYKQVEKQDRDPLAHALAVTPQQFTNQRRMAMLGDKG